MNRLARLVFVSVALVATSAAQTQTAPQDPRIVRVQRQLGAGNFDAAVSALEAIVAQEDNATAWFLLGRALDGRGDWEAALGAYEVACEHDAVAANAHFQAARLCARGSLVDDALVHVELALEKGFQAQGLLLNDPALARLQENERFRELVPPLPPSTELFTERPRVLHTFLGEAPGDVFGWIGRDLGDADGDGKSDLLISAPYSGAGGPNAGKIYVYSGVSGALLFERVGKPGEQLGLGIETAGDVNGDGHMDALVGAPAPGPGPGTAYVYSGKDGSTLLTLTVGENGDTFGRKVSGGVDFDGDGHADLLIGAPGGGPTGGSPGKAYVFSGKSGERLAILEGEAPGDAFGAGNAVWGNGDVKLLALGAANAGDGDRGRTYVYRWEGNAPEPFFTIDSDETGVALGGMFVAFVGDMTGDGISEVYASDWMNGAKGAQTGRVYVHDGADGKRLFVLTGERAGIGFGTCTADVGDVTGDGIADLLIGAWQAPDAARGGGKCYLYRGAARAEDLEIVATYTSNQPGETLGFDTTGVGDLDGDGGVDFLVTGGYSGVCGPQSGRSFVIAGPTPAELAAERDR